MNQPSSYQDAVYALAVETRADGHTETDPGAPLPEDIRKKLEALAEWHDRPAATVKEDLLAILQQLQK